MRRNTLTIFAILLLSILVLCSGCVLPGNEKPVVNGGLSQITVAAETSRIGFEGAHQKLKDYGNNVLNESASEKSIYYILAKDVDESGNATSWVFGIGQGSGAKLLVYDRTGWTVFPWNTHIQEKITLDRIVSPNTLFAQNKAVIVTNPSQTVSERRDLELQQGTYTLTIYSGSTNRILTFNATTGTLIV